MHLMPKRSLDDAAAEAAPAGAAKTTIPELQAFLDSLMLLAAGDDRAAFVSAFVPLELLGSEDEKGYLVSCELVGGACNRAQLAGRRRASPACPVCVHDAALTS